MPSTAGVRRLMSLAGPIISAIGAGLRINQSDAWYLVREQATAAGVSLSGADAIDMGQVIKYANQRWQDIAAFDAAVAVGGETGNPQLVTSAMVVAPPDWTPSQAWAESPTYIARFPVTVEGIEGTQWVSAQNFDIAGMTTTDLMGIGQTVAENALSSEYWAGGTGITSIGAPEISPYGGPIG